LGGAAIGVLATTSSALAQVANGAEYTFAVVGAGRADIFFADLAIFTMGSFATIPCNTAALFTQAFFATFDVILATIAAVLLYAADLTVLAVGVFYALDANGVLATAQISCAIAVAATSRAAETVIADLILESTI
jgi:hypothetical protein